jgi:hypothetical protein
LPERPAQVFADLEDLNNVRMAKPGNGLGLGSEAFQPVRAGRSEK